MRRCLRRSFPIVRPHLSYLYIKTETDCGRAFEDAFTRARHDKTGRQLPQAIAHRGYKAKYPENTMSAFTEAVRVGAHAIETDIHLSKDGVVVLSHVGWL